MSGYWYAPDDNQAEQNTFQGSAHSVSSEPIEKCPAEEVRRVAQEISRQRLPLKSSRRMGF